MKIVHKQIQKNINFGAAKIQKSKDISEDKMYKLNNPRYNDKPFLIEPEEYDDRTKLSKNIEKMKEKSKK